MLLVDDQAAVRRGIRAYLEVLGIDVVAEAGDGREALRKQMDCVTATARITRRHPAVRVVILTSFGQQDRIQAALANGAEHCLFKDASPGEVVSAIRSPNRDLPIAEKPTA
ncbi:response regulator [Amycolatopsis tolypomycina]|uniref:response regulator n=1 Tax=Amycolatopsis tolypomycina TaxID=208445 RepID=UPI0033ADE5B2